MCTTVSTFTMVPILSGRRGSQRCWAKNIMLALLMVLVAFVSGQPEFTQAELEAMTEAELEDICIKRGFQLVNDNSDELTKQDYIEAAQRCLAIEQEMNELLTQYPELADELEEEIQRMERENSQKRDHVESLENKISNDSTDDSRSDPGMAFTRPTTGRGSGNEGHSSDTVKSDEPVASDKASADAVNDDLKSPGIGSSSTMDSDHTAQDEETSVGTIEARETSKEDLTLTHIAIESLRVLVKNAQDDVRRIINLAIPVLQPLFNVGDAAWRQMKDLFVRVREAYEAYQATNAMPSNDAAGAAETCDDSVYA